MWRKNRSEKKKSVLFYYPKRKFQNLQDVSGYYEPIVVLSVGMVLVVVNLTVVVVTLTGVVVTVVFVTVTGVVVTVVVVSGFLVDISIATKSYSSFGSSLPVSKNTAE